MSSFLKFELSLEPYHDSDRFYSLLTVFTPLLCYSVTPFHQLLQFVEFYGAHELITLICDNVFIGEKCVLHSGRSLNRRALRGASTMSGASILKSEM